MRIGIDITPVIYQGTGVSVYTRQLVRHLVQIAPNDHFILFASTFRGQKKLWQFLKTLNPFNNFSVRIFPFPPLITEIAWNKLHRFSVERLVGEVDVFHAWDWQQPPAKKAKLITTIHDLTPLKFPQEHQAKTIAVHQRRLRWVKQEADAIITDSESARQDVVNLLRVNRDKLHIVYLAAAEQYDEFKQQKPEIKNQQINKVKKKYNIKGDYLLSVGTLEPRKNLDRVVQAFQQADKLFNYPINLVIAGSYGWGENLKLSRQAKQKIKLLGYVQQQNLPSLFAGAKAFIYPSLYEGFGLPVLEAMSVGCPVVTSNRGSLKEIAGDAAVIVNPENHQAIAAGIKTALAGANSLKKLGFKQAKKFSWTITAKKTLAIYKSTT